MEPVGQNQRPRYVWARLPDSGTRGEIAVYGCLQCFVPVLFYIARNVCIISYADLREYKVLIGPTDYVCADFSILNVIVYKCKKTVVL